MASAIIAEPLIIILDHVTSKEDGVGPSRGPLSGIEPYWATEVAGQGTCVHPHSCEQRASACAPFVQAAGERAHHSNKWSCMHACLPRAGNHPFSHPSTSPQSRKDLEYTALFWSSSLIWFIFKLNFSFHSFFPHPKFGQYVLCFQRVSCWCTDKSPEHLFL